MKRIVIVDDSASYCDLWSNFILDRYQDVATIETYTHPYDALPKIDDTIDLLIVDLEMPGMDGQATLKAIKADPELRDIPVVMMTGVCDEQEMQTAARNGANSYTIKPANVEQFLRTVLASTNYWLTIHQYPTHHVSAELCRR